MDHIPTYSVMLYGTSCLRISCLFSTSDTNKKWRRMRRFIMSMLMRHQEWSVYLSVCIPASVSQRLSACISERRAESMSHCDKSGCMIDQRKEELRRRLINGVWPVSQFSGWEKRGAEGTHKPDKTVRHEIEQQRRHTAADLNLTDNLTLQYFCVYIYRNKHRIDKIMHVEIKHGWRSDNIENVTNFERAFRVFRMRIFCLGCSLAWLSRWWPDRYSAQSVTVH